MYLSWDELRLAAGEASDFLEFSLFFRGEGMVDFAFQIELFMSSQEIVGCLNRKQMKIPVEFIQDGQTGRGEQAFRHRESNSAVVDGGFLAFVVDIQYFV